MGRDHLDGGQVRSTAVWCRGDVGFGMAGDMNVVTEALQTDGPPQQREGKRERGGGERVRERERGERRR